MFSEFVLEILTSATVSAALTGLLLWLTKSWITERLKHAIKSEYDQKLETHKAQLKSQTEIEIEKLKSSLSIAAAERSVKFSKLHEERALVIAETYSRLKEVYITVGDYIKIFEPAGDKPRNERREIATKAHAELRFYYPKKLIFLPHSVAERLEKLDFEIVKLFNEFAIIVDTKPNGDIQKWYELFQRMQGEMREALGELENEFRRLLGDES
ncbi:MAG: hypothetical protein R3F37_00485 [Candidatus Competibacteraceae bacterium]